MKPDNSIYRLAFAVAAGVVFYFGAFQLWPLPQAGEARCGGAITPISSIQGRGAVTPLDGEIVTTRGVVTGDFTDRARLGGFFMQQPGAIDQSRSGASRALFVYAPELAVAPGERLLVKGEAGEYYGMTQLSDVVIEARCGRGGPVMPVVASLPLSDGQRQRLQGMKLRLEPPLTITGMDELGPYGVLTVADTRLFAPTQVRVPGPAAMDTADDNRRRLLRIDDGSRRRNPPLPDGVQSAMTDGGGVRVGDRIEVLKGILDYRYGEWRLQPLESVSVRKRNTRPEALPRLRQGRVRVASFNLENYFNGNGRGAGFPTDRGARSHPAMLRQQARLLAALRGLAADVVGLNELENDGYGRHSSIAGLTRAMGDKWRYVAPAQERLGADAIAVGLIYRGDRLAPEGAARTLHSGPFSGRNRPPLAQRFRLTGSDHSFWVVVNHFKSKYCGDASGDNQAQGDGQGCWNPARVRAAGALSDWVLELARNTGEERFVLVGDLNAYAREQPLQVLSEAGFSNALEGHHALPASGYIYRGRSGTLDYILASSDMKPLVADGGVWPINADEAPVMYYSAVGQYDLPASAIPDGRPWRSSDHDPTWVDIALVRDDDR